METETIFILLFVVATAVVIGGAAAGRSLHSSLGLHRPRVRAAACLRRLHLTKALLFSVFLPGLLFEAACHIEFKQFWRNRIAISSLALPGMVAAIGLTAVILIPVANLLHFVQGFSWQHALVFGALIFAIYCRISRTE